MQTSNALLVKEVAVKRVAIDAHFAKRTTI